MSSNKVNVYDTIECKSTNVTVNEYYSNKDRLYHLQMVKLM